MGKMRVFSMSVEFDEVKTESAGYFDWANKREVIKNKIFMIFENVL
jgi:hypothetical protein